MVGALNQGVKSREALRLSVSRESGVSDLLINSILAGMQSWLHMAVSYLQLSREIQTCVAICSATRETGRKEPYIGSGLDFFETDCL